jgi:opacity protein-like surface antigen
MKRTSFKFSIFVAFSLWFLTCSAGTSHMVYGFDAAAKYEGDADSVYIQTGSFFNLNNAEEYRARLQSKIRYPVKLNDKVHFYTVAIGPIHSTYEVHVLAQYLLKEDFSADAMMAPVEPGAHPSKMNRFVKWKPWVAKSNWFGQVGVGGQNPHFSPDMEVNNASFFPGPYNLDRYTVTPDNPTAMLTVFAGRRWLRDKQWFPAYSFGILYEALFSSTMSGDITQYSLPEFKNYTYKWNVSSNLLMVSTKFNIINYQRILPYLSAGIGAAFNHVSGYSETAVPNVTARQSPQFGTNSETQFAYQAGAGVDVQLHPAWLVSLGYQFLSRGSLNSGFGRDSWSNNLLALRSYQSNAIILGATYVFGNDGLSFVKKKQDDMKN